ncbi:unnamed protein product [Vitrella brassicaformis CCMP3155]|uniref:SAM-dependent MTase RsmB/NOP-type domain-containing protein n=2 Tax=Vitrella brassicaformis TaxID=1169539 RepID=A0A0G4EFZ1_VITBC|nr:unnamed protein product [Vitrella brassicaformis CCMP3155]|eukprot:CEL94355.1 unnamed protein product [Vitrella brassicaformis CCMP3155]
MASSGVPHGGAYESGPGGNERGSEDFVRYYQAQRIVPDDEWEAFYGRLLTDLNTTFRIVSGTLHTDFLRSFVEDCRRDALESLTSDPELAKEVQFTTIEWYPDHLAYDVAIPRPVLRKSPALKQFHEFLVKQSEAGTIFRQEAVSMVPPLLLDVRSGHTVLDMCAAPGSKTAQLIEALSKPPEGSADSNSSNREPDGCVVANDGESRRAHMLIHHLRHLSSPNLIVTTHSAQFFPHLFDASTGERLFFDRILCDVPCTGDGTLRKAPSLWNRWHLHMGLGLHKLQLQILRRGLKLLKTGGRLVYSTCSFNPIENEAVVNAVLDEAGEALEVVDCSDELTELARRPGLTTWQVLWKDTWYSTFDETQGRVRRKVKPSMFPPPPPQEPHASHRHTQLRRCLRFFPHLSNTGGFFVCLLEKRAAMPWDSFPDQAATSSTTEDAVGEGQGEGEGGEGVTIDTEENENENDDGGAVEGDEEREGEREGEASTSEAQPAAKDSWRSQEDFMSLKQLVQQLSSADGRPCGLWDRIGMPFGLPADGDLLDALFVRTPPSDAPKKVWYASSRVGQLLQRIGKSPYKIISVGCPAFERVSTGGPYRMLQHAARWLLPRIQHPSIAAAAAEDDVAKGTQQVVRVGREELGLLLAKGEAGKMPRVSMKDESLPEGLRGRLESLTREAPFLAVARGPDDGGGEAAAMSIVLPGWCGRQNVELMLDDNTRYALHALIHKHTSKTQSQVE